jgi:glycosyltransferase involved in cell wall biosynthesis
VTEKRPRVSVVVPVFDPGPYIEPAIRSILGQTLPPDMVEAIFVDDGSTDGTSERLDRLAAEHPATVRVVHIEPSGAPGRPRNIGLEASRGDYVQFLDADDELAFDALEHVVAIADRNDADIVVEKFASASIPRSQRLFDRSVERTTLAEMPPLADSSMGPAKLYRRMFLVDNGIRFPEGWRRMEDQYFTIHAYARAGRISIAADRPSYFYNRREDGGHLTSERIDPDRHFRDLRTVLDLIETEFGPGDLRDRIVRRMLRIEVLNKVSEPAYLELTDDERHKLFVAARDLIRERIEPSAIEGLGAVRRHRCELLRDDRPDELLAIARELADVVLSLTVERAEWSAGVLVMSMTARLIFASSGESLRIGPADPADARQAAGANRDRHPYSVIGDGKLARLQLTLRSRPSILEWYLRAPGRPSSDHVGTTATARIDPMHVGAGAAPLGRGSWDVLTRLSGLGIERSVAVGANVSAAVAAALQPALLGDPPSVVVPVVSPDGLRLEVDPPPEILAAALRTRPIRVIRDGSRLAFELPMASGSAASVVAASLVIRAPGADRVIPARLVPRRGGVVLESTVDGPGGVVGVAPGRYPVALRLGGVGDPGDVVLGEGVVREARLRMDGLARRPRSAGVRSGAGWVSARAVAAGYRVGRRIKRSVRR